MKRLIALLVAVVMLVSVAVTAFAKAGDSVHNTPIHINTIGSDDGPGVEVGPGDPIYDNYLNPTPDPKGGANTPTGKTTTQTPVKKSGISVFRHKRKDGLDAVLILTPYDERSTIIYDKSRSEISEAHAEVEAAKGELDTLDVTLREKAEEAGTTVPQCYVTEIFDLTYYLILPDYVQSDDHGTFHITLGRDKLMNFVALMHRYNGVWKVVPDARVVGENMDTLEFSAGIFSPFAVVVWGDKGLGYGGKKSPKTADDTFAYAAYAAGLILSLAAVGYVLVKGRKRI